eukprot:6479424-Amphidinium_carterae.3
MALLGQDPASETKQNYEQTSKNGRVTKVVGCIAQLMFTPPKELVSAKGTELRDAVRPWVKELKSKVGKGGEKDFLGAVLAKRVSELMKVCKLCAPTLEWHCLCDALAVTSYASRAENVLPAELCALKCWLLCSPRDVLCCGGLIVSENRLQSIEASSVTSEPWNMCPTLGAWARRSVQYFAAPGLRHCIFCVGEPASLNHLRDQAD